MLSICIPIYRYDVRPLVAELLRQAEEFPGEIEILVYDDASPDDGDWGREELRQTAGIRYVELSENLGRAAIRNKMARGANNKYLLMMDSDGWPNKGFLLTYFKMLWQLEAKNKFDFLFVGGRHYKKSPPASKYSLHWHYGHERESKPATIRNENRFLGFQSNNFLTTKSILLRHPFPEEAEGYGHEDTQWAQSLPKEEFWFFHLENPVIHLGLEPNDVFLSKQRQAIRNLALLKQQNLHLCTRLIDLVERYPRLTALAKHLPEKWMTNYLASRSRPNLLVLDLLKLKWWHTEKK
ncbi:glycosyltransferase family 2 protein [Neolewinella agarilytica]|uniref:glycosyltransferase family 2 protein n=1 Tax=Neolewinella agarilytica TaxID=478744 RepID=UPI002354B24D|nr:glycosyltransferase family 2 protein [Neolewinella agarilytica]